MTGTVVWNELCLSVTFRSHLRHEDTQWSLYLNRALNAWLDDNLFGQKKRAKINWGSDHTLGNKALAPDVWGLQCVAHLGQLHSCVLQKCIWQTTSYSFIWEDYPIPITSMYLLPLVPQEQASKNKRQFPIPRSPGKHSNFFRIQSKIGICSPFSGPSPEPLIYSLAFSTAHCFVFWLCLKEEKTHTSCPVDIRMVLLSEND